MISDKNDTRRRVARSDNPKKHLRAHPVDDEASNNKWQWSKKLSVLCTSENFFGYHNRTLVQIRPPLAKQISTYLWVGACFTL